MLVTRVKKRDQGESRRGLCSPGGTWVLLGGPRPTCSWGAGAAFFAALAVLPDPLHLGASYETPTNEGSAWEAPARLLLLFRLSIFWLSAELMDASASRVASRAKQVWPACPPAPHHDQPPWPEVSLNPHLLQAGFLSRSSLSPRKPHPSKQLKWEPCCPAPQKPLFLLDWTVLGLTGCGNRGESLTVYLGETTLHSQGFSALGEGRAKSDAGAGTPLGSWDSRPCRLHGSVVTPTLAYTHTRMHSQSHAPSICFPYLCRSRDSRAGALLWPSATDTSPRYVGCRPRRPPSPAWPRLSSPQGSQPQGRSDPASIGPCKPWPHLPPEIFTLPGPWSLARRPRFQTFVSVISP